MSSFEPFQPTDDEYITTYTGTGIPEHGINTGDRLIIRPQNTAQPGQLIVTAGNDNRVKPYETGDRVLALVTWVVRRVK